jgi:hypothetical protein
VRRTAFRLFCGGETLEECAQRVENIRKYYNLRAIVDYSTEEKHSVEDWNENLRIKCDMIRKASRLFDDSMSFVPLKCTAMFCPTTLERLCKLMSESSGICTTKTLALLPESEKRVFEEGMARLRKLCTVARECQVPLLLDAEQSNRQPAIELIARLLSQEFNSTNIAPVVYNTYQMYLTRSPDALHFDLQYAESNGFIFAAKVVRGAYLVTERSISKAQSTKDPVLPSKEATDKAYDDVIDSLLNTIADSRSSPVYVVVATHNQPSIERAMKLMKERHIHNSDPRVHFAQILGMADYCSNLLAVGGYNVSKLISFGPFDELLPWLLRRLDENQVGGCLLICL